MPEADGKRHIRHVIGPDEYHENVDDSAFTNVMARWNIERALETIERLRAQWPAQAAVLWEKLALSDMELSDWRDAAALIVTGFDADAGLYEEFAGYHHLEYIDLAAHAERTQPIDVVIGRERTQRSQIVKQADIVALGALLPEAFPGGTLETNFRHYEPRCAHGSSLSAGMHAVVSARLGKTDMALHFLREAATADLDTDPNSAGGVRIAGLGAVWQAVVLGFAGLELADDVTLRRAEAADKLAQPIVQGALARAASGDPHRWDVGGGDAGGGRGHAVPRRRLHPSTGGGGHADRNHLTAALSRGRRMPSRRSAWGLDGVNFFVAAVQTGFGIFVTLFLLCHSFRWSWTMVVRQHG